MLGRRLQRSNHRSYSSAELKARLCLGFDGKLAHKLLPHVFVKLNYLHLFLGWTAL